MSETSTEDLARRGLDAIEHTGVKGMKWGVRKAETSGSGSSSGGAAKTQSTTRKVAGSAGKAVGKAAGRAAAIAVVSSTGGIAVAAISGNPIAGAAAAAAIRGALGVRTHTTSSDSSFSGGKTIKVLGTKTDGKYDIVDPNGRHMSVDESILRDMIDQTG